MIDDVVTVVCDDDVLHRSRNSDDKKSKERKSNSTITIKSGHVPFFSVTSTSPQDVYFL